MAVAQANEKNTEKYFGRLAGTLYLLTICIITGVGLLNHYNLYEILKLNLISLVLVSILVFYSKEIQNKLMEHPKNRSIIIGAYFFSMLCVMVSGVVEIYNIWLLGPMLIAMLIDVNYGICFQLLFSFVMSVLSGNNMDSLLFYIIFGILGCILAQYMVEMSKIIYVLIIFISSNITLIFIMNNFMMDRSVNVNVAFSVLSSLLVCAILLVASSFYKRMYVKNMDVQKLLVPEETVADSVMDSQTIEKLIQDEYLLLVQLRNFSKKLYQRSMDIGDISAEAAGRIEADVNLTKAGGYYCKIGRIEGKDYINEGVKILKKYHFPDEIVHIVEHHNLKYGNPSSKEGAIVMLTDSIISSIDAMKSRKDAKPVPISKLIDGIFVLKLSKSNLDECGLSVTDLKVLKEFYQDAFKGMYLDK